MSRRLEPKRDEYNQLSLRRSTCYQIIVSILQVWKQSYLSNTYSHDRQNSEQTKKWSIKHCLCCWGLSYLTSKQYAYVQIKLDGAGEICLCMNGLFKVLVTRDLDSSKGHKRSRTNVSRLVQIHKYEYRVNDRRGRSDDRRRNNGISRKISIDRIDGVDHRCIRNCRSLPLTVLPITISSANNACLFLCRFQLSPTRF